MFDIPDQSTEFVDFWNEILAEKFIAWRHILVDGLAHHSATVLPSLEVHEGDRIVDVACGFGDTAIALAQRAGSTGSVLGIDCCQAFLDLAEADAAATGVDNVEFVAADAQDYEFLEDYDFCFSRFGAMYFANPVVGFKVMRSALKPGGRMTAIVWRDLEENPWLYVPKQIILDYLPEPGADARTCGPGPFSMTNESVVRRQLEIAGYRDIEFERVDAPILVGADAAEAVRFQLAIGPAGEVFREAGDEAADQLDDISVAMTQELARYRTDEGIVMDSSSWRISARNPG